MPQHLGLAPCAPAADCSACCYVFCLHSQFPGCLAQVIPPWLDLLRCFGTLPAAGAAQHPGRNCLRGSRAGSQGLERAGKSQSAPQTHCVQVQTQVLGVTFSSSLPWIPPRKERQHRLIVSPHSAQPATNPSVLSTPEGFPNHGQEMNRVLLIPVMGLTWPAHHVQWHH